MSMILLDVIARVLGIGLLIWLIIRSKSAESRMGRRLKNIEDRLADQEGVRDRSERGDQNFRAEVLSSLAGLQDRCASISSPHLERDETSDRGIIGSDENVNQIMTNIVGIKARIEEIREAFRDRNKPQYIVQPDSVTEDRLRKTEPSISASTRVEKSESPAAPAEHRPPEPLAQPNEHLLAYLDSVKQVLLYDKVIKKQYNFITDDEITNLIDIYVKCFQSYQNIVAADIETILQMRDVEFRHVTVGFSQVQANGFDKIPDSEAFKLCDDEKRKWAAQKADITRPDLKDIILFELCPQIIYRKKILRYGKVIIS
ncbi:MAG: hypothetical protein PHI34_05180 [Acidobacteriota bacterium]|nr:hypothetical protein [Acidobacteriota bacterium]